MKKFSKELMDMITDFIMYEIGSSGIDGVTYAMKLKNSKNAKDIEMYTEILNEAQRCGYEMNEVIRALELSNGIVFDLDMKVMTNVLVKIAEMSCQITGKYDELSKQVWTEPKEVRIDEIKRLANAICRAAEKGEDKVSVALFNKNRVNRIRYTESNGNNHRLYEIDAYKVRTYDIAAMNTGPLSKTGYIVKEVIPKYILPAENGVFTELVFCRKGTQW